jgi:hypothetical protein
MFTKLKASTIGITSTGISGGGCLPQPSKKDVTLRHVFKTPEAQEGFRLSAYRGALSTASSGDLDEAAPQLVRTDLPLPASPPARRHNSVCVASAQLGMASLETLKPRCYSAPHAASVKVADLWADTPDIGLANPFAQAANPFAQAAH